MKIVLKVSLSLLLVVLILASWTYFIIPKSEISGLEKGYVKRTSSKTGQKFKFVAKRPKGWVVLSKMKKVAVNAIMISEDWAFYQHSGVDSNQLKKAVLASYNGKKLRGASTISQQLVKNLFLSSNRSFLRKYKELIITLYMEKVLSKDKILEIYLNIIEYGKNLYGIEAASRKYFSHGAASLNALEATFLAMLLPNPKKYSQSFREKRLTKYAKSTMHSIIDKLYRAKMISKKMRNRLKRMRLNFEKRKRGSKSLRGKPGIEQFKRWKKKRNTDDGSSYERRYKSDRNFEIDEGPEFDPDAMIEDESGLDEEFQVE